MSYRAHKETKTPTKAIQSVAIVRTMKKTYYTPPKERQKRHVNSDRHCLPNVALEFPRIITTHQPLPESRVKKAIGTITLSDQQTTDQVKCPP